MDKLTTIQAGIMLNVALSLCGLDKPGWAYSEHALAMATRMGLFNGTHQFQSRRMRDAADFTAWAAFSWAAYVQPTLPCTPLLTPTSEISFAFHRLPTVPDPPTTPLPSPAENPQWYGELWLRYPHSNARYPFRYGYIFKALAELMVILHDASKFLFSSPPLATTEALATTCARFTQWYAGLPPSLLPRNIALPAQLRLHLWYYQAILHTMHNSPPLLTPLTDPTVLAAFSGVHPRTLVAHAKTAFETLLRVYYLRHGFDRLDMTCTAFFLQQGFVSIEALAKGEDPARHRSTLVLVAKCLYDQGKSAHMARTLYQLLVAQLPGEVVEELGRFAGSWRGEMRAEDIRSEYVVGAGAMEGGRVGDMVQEFRELGVGEGGSEVSSPG